MPWGTILASREPMDAETSIHGTESKAEDLLGYVFIEI